MKFRRFSYSSTSSPIRFLLSRALLIILVLASLVMILLSARDRAVTVSMREILTEISQPILRVMSLPVSLLGNLAGSINSLSRLRAEHDELLNEVKRLEQWQEVARRLDVENQALRKLLNFVPEPGTSSVTARVIADSGGIFVRNILVAAGSSDGVAKGEIAMSGEGLVGRVSDITPHSARILLLTDLNSHVPVINEATRERAILAGDNSPVPHLLYLPHDSQVKKGDRIVTSGHGGAFPPGLPIGKVSEVGSHGVLVELIVDWAQLDYVRLIDYGLNDLLPAPTSPIPPRGTHK
ncbi:MAG: rod shape-determining protein MreC [Candidatus Symbiobacter sp.]|nr:rod shape-determining protein MreC [Candidatus Symbiobacter sp.]